MESTTSINVNDEKPILAENLAKTKSLFGHKYKAVGVLIIVVGFSMLFTLGVFVLYTGAHSKYASVYPSELSIQSTETLCPGEEPFEELTQLEIESLKVPDHLLDPDLVEFFTDEELDWLLQEQIPDYPDGLIRKHIRKEVRNLTLNEWMTYGRAIRKMKSTFPTSSNRSEYDILVAAHAPGISPYAHFGPSTLPWHRVYLDKFESVLTVHETNVSLPYWDTALDEPLPTPKHSILWSDKLFGTNRGAVESGIFGGHTNPDGYCSEKFGQLLYRRVNDKLTRRYILLNNDIIDRAVLNYSSYTEVKTPVTLQPADDASSLIESYHSGFHLFTSGQLEDVACGPVDPIFWLWHASLDAIWEEFRTESQITDPQLDYPVFPDIKEGYLPYAPMLPFSSFPNIYGLSDHFTNYRYAYTTRPTKYSCSIDKDCGSELGYLWCDDCGRCVSKLMEGGDCSGLSDKACFCGELDAFTPACFNNTCVCM